MHSENQLEGLEQVSQDTLEAILKLAHTGSSPEAISFFFGLEAQTVNQIIANDPVHRARVVQSIKERSAKYRCAQSKSLMISPVMARDGMFYEQSILEADPTFSRYPVMSSTKLNAEIADFSKESLKVLEGYLRQKDPQEDILQLTAECLSVLSPDAGLEWALRVLGAVEGETLRKLTGMLSYLVQEEMLIGLMRQLARELPSHALCLAALIILYPGSEKAFEEALGCFTELLSQTALGPEAIDLAEEVSERLSSYQLGQMNAALGACPREGGDRLDGLRLKEAYALLREGDVEAAICLVNTLRISPRLEKEVLRFFDEAGLSSGKVPILEQRLSAKLEEINRDSPSLSEVLSILHQLLNAELHSRKSEATSQSLISLKTEVLNETVAEIGQQTSNALLAQDARIQRLEEQTHRKEADDQETLVSLRADVETLTAELEKTNQTVSEYQLTKNALMQRSDLVKQEYLANLREEIRALHAAAAISGEEAEQLRIEIDKTQGTVAASEMTIDLLRQEVKDIDEAWSQFKRTHSSQKELLQELHEKSRITETTQRALISRTDTLEARTDVLFADCEEIKHFKKTQDDVIQRSEAATQESLVSLREELQVLYELTSRLGEEARQTQSFIEQPQNAEAATQQALCSLRQDVEVLRKNLSFSAIQCKRAHAGQETIVQSFVASSQKAETATQQALSTLRQGVVVLSKDLAHVASQWKMVNAGQETIVQGFVANSQKAEEATQQALCSLRQDVEVLRKNLSFSAIQCKRAHAGQETIVQSFVASSQKAETATQQALSTLRQGVVVLSKDLAHVASQWKMVNAGQETIVQGFVANSQKAEEATQQALFSLRQETGTLHYDLNQVRDLCKRIELEAMLLKLELIESMEKMPLTSQHLYKKLQPVELSSFDKVTLPTFIYSYKYDTHQLYMTKLITGDQSSHQVNSYTFKIGCCWSEVPGGSLLITGGGYPAVSEVVRIDVGTFEVSLQPVMLTPRREHAAVYYYQRLYVIGGVNEDYLSECEEYVCAENRWEALPPLPRACIDTSGVVLESSLYALGGFDGSPLDLVQKLSLMSLTWELMQLRLPFEGSGIPCFKRDNEVYLVVNKTLCSFTALGVHPLKTLTKDIQSWSGASYYHSGTLYSSSNEGAVRSYELGKLN
jgi:hypothetical protein